MGRARRGLQRGRERERKRVEHAGVHEKVVRKMCVPVCPKTPKPTTTFSPHHGSSRVMQRTMRDWGTERLPSGLAGDGERTRGGFWASIRAVRELQPE